LVETDPPPLTVHFTPSKFDPPATPGDPISASPSAGTADSGNNAART